MSDQFEIAIIGAGPAGLGAATNAAHHKIPHILIEKREIGNTIFDYQLGKLVMAEPSKLPLRAHVEFKQGSREEILESWNTAIAKNGVNVLKSEVKKIFKTGDLFSIQTSTQNITAKYVVLAIGVQGAPRKLGAPGDDLPHIAYTLADPKAFSGKDIVVVGAGDAAIENALGVMGQNRVSLLNRGGEFPRAKEANVQKISEAAKNGKLKIHFNASVSKVEPDSLFISTPQGELQIPCNHIIARLGCILPRKFLEECGIQFPSSDPNAVPVVSSRYESNVPGLFILGALIGYPLIKQAINQGYEVIEHILGNPIEPADQVLVDEKLGKLPGKADHNLAMIKAALPFFADLSEAQFRELIIDSTVHIKKKGDVVFNRNDYTDSFFSIVKGQVAVDVPGKDPVSIAAGNFFGEMGLLSGRRRTATVRAGEEVILLESPRKQILKLNNSVPSFKVAIDGAFALRALQTSAFPDAPAEVLVPVAQKSKLQRFKKGEVLCKEGDLGDRVFVVRKGSVKISRRNPAGDDITQTYISAGNLVGEMAVIGDEPTPRSASVTAIVPVEAIVISRDDFRSILESSPKSKERIAALVQARKIQNLTKATTDAGAAILEFAMAEGVTDADNILLIDSDLCVACDNCERACAATHDGYSRLDRKGGKTFASIQIPVSCRHCENPLCMLDCPPDALTRLPSGEVIIRDSCIGCGNCVRNCPYGVMQLVHEHDHGFSLLRLLGLKSNKGDEGPAKAAKCDLCHGRDGGPACVRSCPTGAAVRVNPRGMLEMLNSKGLV